MGIKTVIVCDTCGNEISQSDVNHAKRLSGGKYMYQISSICCVYCPDCVNEFDDRCRDYLKNKLEEQNK